MASGNFWFFGSSNKKNEKESRNAERVQDLINKYKIHSRDLHKPEDEKEKPYESGWQGYSWLKEATETNNSRKIRYKEYREMTKVPEINQGLNIYCLHPDTIVSTLKGDYTIKELSGGILGDEFEVWSYNIEENRVDIGKAINPHKTLENADVFKVTFKNGQSIIATANHPFLLKTYEYKNLEDLVPGDFVVSEKNQEIISIEYYGKSDVYDMEVEKFHNFNANGVFVHNSDNGTQYNISGNVLEVESDNGRIVEILEKLFFENLDVNADLWGYFRNMCKMGDEFLEVIVDNKENPKNVISLERFKKPENVKRIEENGNLTKFVYEYEDEEKGEKTFQPWQIVHLRIEDEEFEPYGRSILESGRKTFKKLSLMEDAMLIYRISRAPERRVFYIDVGTLSTQDANNFIEKLKRTFRKKKFINPNTGEIDEKADPLCITLDTEIPLLDGRSLALKELIKEYNAGKENWVYSINPENNEVVPGKIIWAGETRKNAQLIKITLDNGKELRTTPDHRFMLRDGSFIEAQDLKENDSLMPLYTKLSSKETGDKLEGYELVYNPSTETYEYTHRLVGNVYDEWKNREYNKLNENKTLHHVDFNKRNNNPTNLRVMSFSDHRNLHHKYSSKYNHLRSEIMKKQFSNPKTRQKYVDGMTIRNKVTESFWELLRDVALNTSPNSQGYVSITNVINNAINNEELMQEWKSFCKPNKQANGPNRHFIAKALKEFGYNSSEQWLSEFCGLPTRRDRVSNTKNATKKFKELNRIKEEETILLLENYFTKNQPIYTSDITSFCKENDYYYTYIKNVLVRNNYTIISSVKTRVEDVLKTCLEESYNYDYLKDFLFHESVSRKQYYKAINSIGLKSFEELRNFSNEKIYQNHKVSKIEWLDYREDTGDITIDTYHNFATEAGVFIHNSVDEDFYIPVRQNSQGTRIETLPAGCLTLDTKIDSLDGNSYTLSEMINKYKDGIEQWIYSTNPETGEVVPGIVSWAGVTRRNSEIVEVELDNGEIVRCTPDHKFPVWGKSFVEAKDLEENDSIISHNKKISSNNDGDRIDGYEKIYDHNKKDFVYTHQMVANYLKDTDRCNEFIYELDEKLTTIHHADFNKNNNMPNNLMWIGNRDHFKYHSDNIEAWKLGYRKWWDNLSEERNEFIEKTESGRIKARENYQNKLKNDPEFKIKIIKKQSQSANKYISSLNKEEREIRKNSINKKMRSTSDYYEKVFGNSYIKFDEYLLTKFVDIFKTKENYTKALEWINENPENDFTEYLAELNSNDTGNFNPYKLTSRFTERFLENYGFENVKDFSDKINLRNHRVVAIRFIEEREDVGTLTIDKEEKYHDYHTFALSCGIYTKNSNLGEIDDVKYFKDRILKTLGIPPGYLGSQAEGGATYDPKSYLSNQEIQFARSVERMQRLVIKGLEKIALIQLAFSNIDVKEIKNFKLKLTPPSNVDQLMEIEIRNQQMTLIQSIRSLENFLPDEWVYREVLGMSEQEIQKVRLQLQMQMQMQMQMQNAAQNMDQGGGLEGGNIAGGAAPGIAGGAAEMGAGPETAGGAEGGEMGGEGGLEVAGNVIEFDGGKWLLENQQDLQKLIKYIKLYEKTHDNRDEKEEPEYTNSLTKMATKGEFRGLLANNINTGFRRVLNENKKK